MILPEHMPEKKKQHYVPRFYLRRFASDRDRAKPKRIGLYQIQRQLVVANASIRDQCAKDYFYGHNGIENALGLLERYWATLLRYVDTTHQSPRLGSFAHALLLLFVSLQMLRTSRHRSIMNTHWDHFLNQLLQMTRSHQPESATQEHKWLNQTMEDPVVDLRPFLAVAVALDDLKLCLLETEEHKPFLTSDNPVFSYNLYCEGVTWMGITGATKTGILEVSSKGV